MITAETNNATQIDQQIQMLLEERERLIVKRNIDAEQYLELIDLIREDINRKENTLILLSKEEEIQLEKERIREIDRELRRLNYTGYLSSGCE